MDLVELLTAALDFGVLGVLVLIIIAVIWKVIPEVRAMLDAFRDDIRLQRHEYLTAMDKITQSFEQEQQRNREIITAMRESVDSALRILKDRANRSN